MVATENSTEANINYNGCAGELHFVDVSGEFAHRSAEAKSIVEFALYVVVDWCLVAPRFASESQAQ